MSSPIPTKNPPPHPPHRSTLPHPHPFRTPLFNLKTGRHPVRHNLPPSTPTISSRSTSNAIIIQIAPFPLHRLPQAPPPLSLPLHRARPAKRAFLQSTSPRAATAITVRTSPRTQIVSSRKLLIHLTMLDGNPVAITCHRRLEVCVSSILISHSVHLTFACLVPHPSRSDLLTTSPETPVMPRRDPNFLDRRFGHLQGC